MKTSTLKILSVLCLAGLLLSAAAQPVPNETPDGTGAPATTPDQPPPPPPDTGVPPPDTGAMNGTDATAVPAETAPAIGNRPAAARPTATPASIPVTPTLNADAPVTSTNLDDLRLNFRNAPLDLVLKYLSDAAGFVIVMDTQVRGNVSVISGQPMNRDEAVDLLNSVLNKNGYAAIREGRTLTIVDKNDAKTRDIPVKVSNDPNSIPKNDEMVTQIIPIRFVEARQLVADLSTFGSPQAIVANEAGNSIVVTDTQSNIRHLAEIIRAIDDSAEGETEIRVFHLSYANPNDVATELASIFPANGSSGNGQIQTPFRFGGGGGPGGGGPGGGGGFFARMMAAQAASNPQNARVQKQTQVVAVADARTQSVIVTASKDLMLEIANMMTQLDVPSNRDQKVFVYHMSNGDPQQTLQVLQNMFQNNNTSRTGTGTGASSQNSALQNRQTQNATTGGTTGNTSTTGTGLGGNVRGAGSGGALF